MPTGTGPASTANIAIVAVIQTHTYELDHTTAVIIVAIEQFDRIVYFPDASFSRSCRYAGSKHLISVAEI